LPSPFSIINERGYLDLAITGEKKR